MKHIRLAGWLLLVFSVGSCTKSQQLPGFIDTTPGVQTQTNGDAVGRVAADKELLRQTLVLAGTKGTLEAALTEAAQDSLVGIKMREALILGNVAKAHTSAPPKHKTSQNGDVLDKTNQTLDKTNQTLDKTSRTKEKVDQLLNGK
ncbi:MAG: hypothetical protein Q8922_00715 [Bacteroidota bacterium]|nr:hypothetical protein [Bacteroidota bacterium]MDP4232554.1 hypothetical protein [Bacteroidota bacterium]MDP4242991.1 hypothetical protein [Bacteroidota bacterium]MDP4286434.1 hypothetical protein [Bacteroidota bacterium]